MKVKNLAQLFTKFKKFRETKKDIATKDNYYDYVMIGTSQDLIDAHPGYSDLKSIGLSLGEREFPKNSELFIDIDISTLKNSKSENKFPIQDAWIECEEKVEKVLQEIWATGEMKNTYGLDLDWPNSEQNQIKIFPTENSASKNMIEEQSNLPTKSKKFTE